MGKGSRQRPAQVEQLELELRWEDTFGVRRAAALQPSPAPETAGVEAGERATVTVPGHSTS